MIDGAPRGRLLSYSLHSMTLSVLLCGLHFPNGVQLLPGEESLLLVESTRHRIFKINLAKLDSTAKAAGFLHHLNVLEHCSEFGSLARLVDTKGALKEAGMEIFAEKLPGFVDNIRLDYRQQYLLIGIGAITAQPFSLLWIAYRSNALRFFFGRLVSLNYLGTIADRYGLVGVFDLHGSVVASLHDPSGRIHLVSEAQVHPMTGDLWMGSSSTPYVAVLQKEELPEILL